MKVTLKIFAFLVPLLVGAQWLAGFILIDRPDFVLSPAVLLLLSRLVLLCAVAWLLRTVRVSAAGRKVVIERRLVRDRALATAGLLAICFVFAMALDRIGEKPHRTYALSAFWAAWVATGIVALIFCAICLFGGNTRRRSLNPALWKDIYKRTDV